MSKAYLATTAIEDFWDDRLPILFLGEWCLLHRRRRVWNGLRHRMLPPRWPDREETDRARAYLAALYEEVLVRLGATLDGIHGGSRSPRYWRILLGFWLHNYIRVLHERYGSLRRAFDAEPELTTIGLDSACFVTPKESNDFTMWIQEDAYNLQIYTRLWQAMGMSFPVKALAEDRRPISSPVSRSSGGVLEMLLRLIRGGPGKIILCGSYFPRRFQVRLAIRSAGGIISVQQGPHALSAGHLNQTARRGLASALPINNSFEKVLAVMLTDDIPRCFVEDFAAVGETASRHYPRSPKAILSAAWNPHEPFKRWAAEAQEHGTLLLCSQHGGGYGMVSNFAFEDHDMAIADRFYSWGWVSGKSPERIVPMPGGRLMGRNQLGADRHKQGILLVTTMSSRYPWSQFEHPFSEYLKWQARFLAAFPHALRDELRLRPHREDGGWDIVQRLRDQGFSVQIEDWGRLFYQSLNECRLYVSDHLSTTFIESLSADKPTVLFWSPQAELLRSEAIPYCEELKSAGILFDTPEEAAAAVGPIYEDVESWWRNPRRQEIRKKFCSEFGSTSAEAESAWEKELSSILEGRKV